MRTDRVIDVIETHTEGQVTRTVTGGINPNTLTGTTLQDQADAFLDEFGWLMELLLKEPRGHENLVGAIPLDPVDPDADIAYLFFDNSVCFGNCGDGVIGSTTALIETGVLEPTEQLAVEVPAGIVDTRLALTPDNHVEEVAIQGMESFAYEETTTTVELDDDDVTIPVDVAYGGNWFAFVDPGHLDLTLDIETADPDKIIDYGVQIRDNLNADLDITDPRTGDPAAISITMFLEEHDDTPDRSTIVYAAGSIGRSPCGTGTAAKMALKHHQGDLAIEQPYPIESLFGTRFRGRILDIDHHDNLTITRCEVAGSAHIIAKNTYLKDPTDPLDGFLL